MDFSTTVQQVVHGSPTEAIATLLSQRSQAYTFPLHVMPGNKRAEAVAHLKTYLDMCADGGYIADPVRDAAWYAWHVLNIQTGDTLSVPDACPGPTGEVVLSWDSGSKHFEVEVDRSARVTWFYQDPELKKLWEVSAEPNANIDERVKTALGNFAVAKPVSNPPAARSWF